MYKTLYTQAQQQQHSCCVLSECVYNVVTPYESGQSLDRGINSLGVHVAQHRAALYIELARPNFPALACRNGALGHAVNGGGEAGVALLQCSAVELFQTSRMSKRARNSTGLY